MSEMSQRAYRHSLYLKAVKLFIEESLTNIRKGIA